MKNNLGNVFAKMLGAFIAVASCCNCSQGMNVPQHQLNAPQQAGNQLQQVDPRIYYAMTNDESCIGEFVRQAQQAYAFNVYNAHLDNLINAIERPGNAHGVYCVCNHFSVHFGGVNKKRLYPKEEHTFVITNIQGDQLARARWVLNHVEDSIRNCRFRSLDYYRNGGRYTLNVNIPLPNALPAGNLTHWGELVYDQNKRQWTGGNKKKNVTGNIESIEVYLNFDFKGRVKDGTIYPKKS